jgi:hypothetical protein
MKNIFFIKFIMLVCFFSSCGIGFYFKKQITGQYYLIAMDTKEQLNIAYRDGGSNSYSGRVPPMVIEFGFSDSLIVAKSINNVNQIYYYIIDMTKDGDIGREEQYLIGPISEQEYVRNWKEKINIPLTKINPN